TGRSTLSSPSPRPSPPGRGGNIQLPESSQAASDSATIGRQDSLSREERAGGRGNSASEPIQGGTSSGVDGPLPSSLPSPWFEDVSRLLAHTHHEEPFDDFARQPTLPRRLSQLGPGVCWCDLNKDGWDDLVIGAGKGGTLAVFLNDGK